MQSPRHIHRLKRPFQRSVTPEVVQITPEVGDPSVLDISDLAVMQTAIPVGTAVRRISRSGRRTHRLLGQRRDLPRPRYSADVGPRDGSGPRGTDPACCTSSHDPGVRRVPVRSGAVDRDPTVTVAIPVAAPCRRGPSGGPRPVPLTARAHSAVEAMRETGDRSSPVPVAHDALLSFRSDADPVHQCQLRTTVPSVGVVLSTCSASPVPVAHGTLLSSGRSAWRTGAGRARPPLVVRPRTSGRGRRHATSGRDRVRGHVGTNGSRPPSDRRRRVITARSSCASGDHLLPYGLRRLVTQLPSRSYDPFRRPV